MQQTAEDLTIEPENRTERCVFLITPDEMRALRVVAAARPDDFKGYSSVLREMSLEEAVATAAKIQEAMGS